MKPRKAMSAAWQRTCPQCGRTLLKGDPQVPWTCRCGWNTHYCRDTVEGSGKKWGKVGVSS